MFSIWNKTKIELQNKTNDLISLTTNNQTSFSASVKERCTINDMLGESFIFIYTDTSATKN